MKKENIRAAKVLESAAFVLMIPGAWTQSANAKDEEGYPTGTHSNRACKWCAIGAIGAAARDDVAVYDAKSALSELMGDSIVLFNDRAGQSAIRVAEKMLLAAEQLREKQ